MDIINDDVRIRTLTENRYEDNSTNVRAIKYLLKHIFDDLTVDNIEMIGRGYDSVAYLVNNEYIFKTKFSTNKKNGYEREKAIYDFLNENLDSDIQVPRVEYFYITDELSIMGYPKIDGIFLTPELYAALKKEEQESLKRDIAVFLKKLHNLDHSEIKQYAIDNQEKVLEEYRLLKSTIYDRFTDEEKDYVEAFMQRLSRATVFHGKKCLCHNDFSCNHLLLDENNRLSGVIDFGDAGIADEYGDFIYLLEDSEEEIGVEFGEDILRFYGDIDIDKAKEYQDMVEQYYPIETIVYGIKNDKISFVEKGKEEIYFRQNNGIYMTNWRSTESTHYVFHYKENSYAHKNIAHIVKKQEQRYREITDYFTVFSEGKTDYFLCDSREELGKLADDEPGNALFVFDDDFLEKVSIYAVYNAEMQCTGYHEETHAVTHLINEPTSSALAEGVAVFMEKTWWGIDIRLCTLVYLQEQKYISVEKLICENAGEDNEYFLEVNCAISYPIIGAFVSFLLLRQEHGKEKFMQLYRYKGDDWKNEFQNVYQCDLSELEAKFIDEIRKTKYTEEEIGQAKERLLLN